MLHCYSLQCVHFIIWCGKLGMIFFFQKDNLYLQLYQKTLHKENFIKKKTEKSKIKKEYWVLLI